MFSARKPGSAGFTLVELMIAVAILAIVAAVALPIYNQYSQRTYRAEAQADLMRCAQAMERFAAQNFTYTGAVLANICDPESVQQGRYNVALDIPNDNQFTITATPVAAGPMGGDGMLTYDEAGLRGWDRDASGDIGAGEDTWEE